MKEVRYGAAGSMREKGLLITGGYNRSTWLSSNEYSSSDVWKSGPPIPVPISHNCQITVGSMLETKVNLLRETRYANAVNLINEILEDLI